MEQKNVGCELKEAAINVGDSDRMETMRFDWKDIM